MWNEIIRLSPTERDGTAQEDNFSQHALRSVKNFQFGGRVLRVIHT